MEDKLRNKICFIENKENEMESLALQNSFELRSQYPYLNKNDWSKLPKA
jgi:hypothetical protein